MSERQGLVSPVWILLALWIYIVESFMQWQVRVGVRAAQWSLYLETYARWRVRRSALWYLLSYRGYSIGDSCDSNDADRAVLGLLRWSTASSGGAGPGRYVSSMLRRA